MSLSEDCSLVTETHQYLPPASEGWGKVIVSVCLSVHTHLHPIILQLVPCPFWVVPQWLVPGPFQGVPQPGPDKGGYPSQVQTGGTPVRDGLTPPPRPGQDGGVPQSGMGYTPGQDRRVTPVSDGVPPWMGQQMEYLRSGGRYTSCVHAGGLSCYSVKFGLHGSKYNQFLIVYSAKWITDPFVLKYYMLLHKITSGRISVMG